MILSLIWASYRMVDLELQIKCYSPWYDWASSSKKEVVWMGMSCISQVQLPCGRLPGNGQVLPEIGDALFKSIFDIVVHYRWDNQAMHMQLFFLSTSCSLGCNSNPYASSLCTHHWCTNANHSLTKLQLILYFVHPRCLHFWTWSHRFQGSPYNPRMDKVRHQELSMLQHSLLPGRKSPPQRCCSGGSRWRCSCFSSWWRRRQRNPLRRRLRCFLGIIVFKSKY